MVTDPQTGVPSPKQTAAIPFRHTRRGVHVCLIRRKTSGTWSIPKGFIDSGETREESALKEALEEAGVTGRIVGECIGTYDYEKRNAMFTVAVFLLEVLEELPAWQEMSFRERMWCSWEEAAAMLASHPVRPLLDRALDLLRADS
jgi:8-oxo-dGTP pyrophosphatase MutT (NUDIX family)